jgi:hypothetical protein
MGRNLDLDNCTTEAVIAAYEQELNEDERRICAHESPHFCATLKSPSLGFPQAAGWRIIREGELCARRRNDLISFMTS